MMPVSFADVPPAVVAAFRLQPTDRTVGLNRDQVKRRHGIRSVGVERHRCLLLWPSLRAEGEAIQASATPYDEGWIASLTLAMTAVMGAIHRRLA